MTTTSIYATFHPTSLLTYGLHNKCTLIPVHIAIHALLTYSTYVTLPFYPFIPLHQLLQSDATRRAVRHNPAARIISHAPRPPRRLPTTHQQQSAFIRYLHKLLPSSSRTIAVPPVRNDQPRDPLDACLLYLFPSQLTHHISSQFPATSALPPNHFPSAQALTQGHSHMHPRENPCPSTPPIILSSATASNAGLHHLFTWWPVRAGHTPPPIVNVPLAWGQSRYAAAGAPTRDEDLIRDEDVPPPPDPNSQPPSAGEHGSDRLCGCF
ncbi:hypothetical protein DFH29DRAFT_914519 [Suillus ampliporus]|nr:hypothetical protein DFH29DRAFT_914519 [Suillus ampliporus]